MRSGRRASIFFSPRGYDRIRREGRKVLMNILDIEAPVFTAFNGPVRLHAEYALLTDIVLATPEAVFQDWPDGVNPLRPEVIGSMRGRYFLLTGQELDARTARDWGAVNEIAPGERLLPRGHELADRLAALAPLPPATPGTADSSCSRRMSRRVRRQRPSSLLRRAYRAKRPPMSFRASTSASRVQIGGERLGRQTA